LERALERQPRLLALMDQVAHAAIRAETLDEAIKVGAMLTGWPVVHADFLDDDSGELAPSGLFGSTPAGLPGITSSRCCGRHPVEVGHARDRNRRNRSHLAP
jgi:hypothetical protein